MIQKINKFNSQKFLYCIAYFSVFFTLPTFANFDVQDQMEIQVDCPLADVSYLASAQKQIQIQAQLNENGKMKNASNWNFQTQQDLNKKILSVKCEPPVQLVEKPNLSRLVIQIRGPSVATRFHVKSGSIQLNGLKHSSVVSLQNGTIKAVQTSQSLVLNLIQGAIDIENHNGRIKIEAFESKTKVTNSEGPVAIHQFSGNLFLKNIQGEAKLSSKKTAVTVENSQGSFQFDVDQGRIDFENYSGSIDGEVEQAPIQAKLINPARFKLKGKSVQAKLQVPTSSGAQVSLSITEGQFQVPSFLSQDNSGALKTVRGSLRGGESGRIQISAESGRVQLSTY